MHPQQRYSGRSCVRNRNGTRTLATQDLLAVTSVPYHLTRLYISVPYSTYRYLLYHEQEQCGIQFTVRFSGRHGRKQMAQPLLALAGVITTAPRRPLDDLGPPSDSLPFPPPHLVRGRRGNVTVYNSSTGDLEIVTGVLFRAETDSTTNQKLPFDKRVAYFTDPHRHPIET